MNAGCSLEDACPPKKFAAFRAAHPRSHRADLYQLFGGGEGLVRHHRNQQQRGDHPCANPARSTDYISDPTGIWAGICRGNLTARCLLWPGVCIVHEAFSETELLKLKAQHPNAPIAAHPECPPAHHRPCRYGRQHQRNSEIRERNGQRHGDYRPLSRTSSIKWQRRCRTKISSARRVRTAIARATSAPYMALNTMEKLYLALRDLSPAIELDEGVRVAAKASLDRMLSMAGGHGGSGRHRRNDTRNAQPPVFVASAGIGRAAHQKSFLRKQESSLCGCG